MSSSFHFIIIINIIIIIIIIFRPLISHLYMSLLHPPPPPSDTPWQQQPQQALASSGHSSGTTAMVEEEEEERQKDLGQDGLVFEQVTVQTLGQSNDLWVFRLPLATTTAATTSSSTTSSSSSSSSASSSSSSLTTAIAEGFDRAEIELELDHDSAGSSTSDGDLDRRYHASHSSSPSHPPTRRPSLAPAQTVGWLILSAGGCHSGDDGSVYESAVNTSAVLVAVMIGFATVGGLTAYQILKYRDTDQQHQSMRKPPFSNGNSSSSSIAMTPTPSPQLSTHNVTGATTNGLNSSKPLGSSSSSSDDILGSRHQPVGVDGGVPLSPYQLLRNYQQPDPSPTSARQPSRSTSASAIQPQHPPRPVSAPPPTHYGLTSPAGPTAATGPSAPSSGLGLGLLASLRGYTPLTDATDGL